MIQLQNISLAFAGEPVLEGLSWTITPGQRIGLIGPNGAGKTTLLRVIDGRLQPDAGRVERGGQSVGYLEQSVQEQEAERSVRDEALQAFSDVLDLEEKEQQILSDLDEETDYESTRYEKLLHRLERVQARLSAEEAHTVRARTEATLTGLGFDPDALSRPLSTFSGGWRMRAALARLLLQRPDVLLLDEPTNHLDIDSIGWLEGYLAGYPGTVVLTSHDRFFLDRMVTSIAELSRGQITPYHGNYSHYLEARVERRELQRARYENQQKKIADIEAFIRRFRYQASKANQVQSRIKHLEKMERVAPPPSEDAAMTLRLPEPPRSGQVVMGLSAFSKTYPSPEGAVEVFDHAGPLQIERGDKIALIGPNGAGKSTLARILLGEEPFEGRREVGYRVQAAHFAQHQADALDARHTVLESLRERAPGRSDTELRTLLGAFLFTGDDVFKSVSVLSGGERSRVALARTLLHPANFLVLDEPTNHLDIQSKDVLVEALRQYAGTFVLVSHDRHFIGEVAESIWRVDGGQVKTFSGTYAEYEWHREHGTAARLGSSAAAASGDGTASAPAPASTNGASPDAPEHGARANAEKDEKGREWAGLNAYQLRKALNEKEAAILEKEEEQAALEADLADPALYDDPEAARATTEAYESLQADLAGLYAAWEALTDQVVAREEA